MHKFLLLILVLGTALTQLTPTTQTTTATAVSTTNPSLQDCLANGGQLAMDGFGILREFANMNVSVHNNRTQLYFTIKNFFIGVKASLQVCSGREIVTQMDIDHIMALLDQVDPALNIVLNDKCKGTIKTTLATFESLLGNLGTVDFSKIGNSMKVLVEAVPTFQTQCLNKA